MTIKKVILIIISMIVFVVTSYKAILEIRSIAYDYNYYINIDADVLKSKINSNSENIIYFYKKDCSACAIFKKNINKVIKKNNFIIYAVDIYENKYDQDYLINECKIEITPTLIIYNQAKEVSRIEGYRSYKNLLDFLNNKS